MHVTPSDLRIVQQDRIVIRFALLGSMAFVQAELPASGSAGTSVEQRCEKPHWGFVTSGEFEFECGDRRETLRPGDAFHVPAGGPAHRFTSAGAGRIAGFEPIDGPIDTSEAALAAQGLKVVPTTGSAGATIIPSSMTPLLKPRQIDASVWPMSNLVLARTRFGPGSGYSADWCDAPHWGLVTSGQIAIEWEDDLEILSPGDIYHCPAGPPGHRIEAADPASIIDLTPIEAIQHGRIASWRSSRPKLRAVEAGPIAVAGLGLTLAQEA